MFWNKKERKNVFIEKGGHVTFGRGEFKIRCSKGIIWMTWPWSEDLILNSGDEISLRTEGILCMKSFTGSIIEIEKRRIFPCVKSIPRVVAVKAFKALFSLIKGGAHESVFGGSVHSIIR